MENSNSELADADMIQESVQRFLDIRVENEASPTNRLSASIFMVPSILRDVSPNSFNPRLVSIGPLHREDNNVQVFERQKPSYLIYLMSRIQLPRDQVFKSCMEKAYASLNKIKACYVWTKKYGDVEIAEMMVMDACFMIEFMAEACISIVNNSYSGSELKFVTVLQDFLLLENQIPLFFLQEIFQCTILKSEFQISFITLIHRILCGFNLFEADILIDNHAISTAPHILSLLHQCYKPPHDIREDSMKIVINIRSAIDLDMAGVNFKPNKDPTWLLGMEVKQGRFQSSWGSWSKPTLTMPVLKVDDATELILRNLIAYEQSSQTQSYFTSYAHAIDMLVNTQEDIAKLLESGVLVNNMGSNKEVANMINSICKYTVTGSSYGEEWEKLNKYCNGSWQKHIARMKSIYFSSPWSIIALLGAIILFVLQVVQTIFTVLSSDK